MAARSRRRGTERAILAAMLLGSVAAPSAWACSPSQAWFAMPDVYVHYAPVVRAGGLSKVHPAGRWYREVWRTPGPCGDYTTHVHVGWVALVTAAVAGIVVAGLVRR